MDDIEKRKMRAQALRYKRSALATMGYDTIMSELQEIGEACDDLRWAEENCTEPVLDGDEDDGAGYRMEFSDLSAECEMLLEQLYETGGEMFDDCTVALIGNRFQCVGYDGIEEDWFSLCAYDAGRAATESGKRLMRLTKAEMIDTIGRNVGIMMAFYDLRQRYDYLRAALNVVLDHNLDTLHTVRSIEDAYAAWCEDGFRTWGDKYDALRRQCDALDDIYWIA
jgi:hypothetical protein